MEENKTLISANQFQIIQLNNSWVNFLDKQLKTKITLKNNHHGNFEPIQYFKPNVRGSGPPDSEAMNHIFRIYARLHFYFTIKKCQDKY